MKSLGLRKERSTLLPCARVRWLGPLIGDDKEERGDCDPGVDRLDPGDETRTGGGKENKKARGKEKKHRATKDESLKNNKRVRRNKVIPKWVESQTR